MPNVYQYSLDRLDEILAEISESSIAGILIFGIPKHKDELASGAYDENGITQQAIRYIKVKYPSMLIIADVCLCEYTSHGHCGVVCGHKILNDETLPLLSRMAVSLAKAGADIIAPSDMMDGRVSAIRNAHLMKTALQILLYFLTVQSLRLHIIHRSEMPPSPHLNSATEKAIRWTMQTAKRHCERLKTI